MLSPDDRCRFGSDDANGYVRGEGVGVVLIQRADAIINLGTRGPASIEEVANAQGEMRDVREQVQAGEKGGQLSTLTSSPPFVYARVLGSAVNQDGRSNGLTAPNPAQQERLLRSACADAGVEPSVVVYVEAHGTGTRLGDPIELKALGSVLRGGEESAGEKRKEKGDEEEVKMKACDGLATTEVNLERSNQASRVSDGPTELLVGSAKSNIGHLECAAGIAGLIKASLVAKHRLVPPSLHAEKRNSLVPWERLKVKVCTEEVELPLSPATKEREDVKEENLSENRSSASVLGVSGFGFGGTNAHVILETVLQPSKEEADKGRTEKNGKKKMTEDGNKGQTTTTSRRLMATVVVASSHSRDALRATLERYADFAGNEKTVRPADFAVSAALTRSHSLRARPFRAAVTADDLGALSATLRSLAAAMEGENGGVGMIKASSAVEGRADSKRKRKVLMNILLVFLLPFSLVLGSPSNFFFKLC